MEVLLFNTNTASDKENKNKSSEVETSSTALVLAMIAGFFLIDKNISKIELYYFNHFEEIYLSCYAILVFIALFLIFQIRKKTKDMDARFNLLSPMWIKNYFSTPIGLTKDKIKLYLTDEARCSHVQVIGSTGRGKTKSVVIPWTIRDLKRGKSVIIIDGKGSTDLPEEIFYWLERGDIECQKFHFDLDNPESSIRINPLKHGTAQQVTDRIFSSFEFDDTFYESVQYDICGYLVRLIIESKEVVTFTLLYDLLTDDKILTELVSKLKEDSSLRNVFKKYLLEPMRERRKKSAGLISQLSPFASSEIAPIVNSTDDTNILSELMLNSSDTKVLIFSIPTLKYQKLGQQLGKLILQELAWSVGERERMDGNKFTSVFLDEFSEFVYDGFISILNKARSAKVGLHLCHQSISDLTKISESFARGVNTNTNIKCILGLNDPETADFYARHFGTVTKSKFTEQTVETGFFKSKKVTGKASMREVESYKVHPNILKELYKGKGVLHLPTSRGVVTEVIMFDAFSEAELENL